MKSTDDLETVADHQRLRQARRSFFRKMREFYGEQGIWEHFPFDYRVYIDQEFFAEQFPTAEDRKRLVEHYEYHERKREEDRIRTISDPAIHRALNNSLQKEKDGPCR